MSFNCLVCHIVCELFENILSSHVTIHIGLHLSNFLSLAISVTLVRFSHQLQAYVFAHYLSSHNLEVFAGFFSNHKSISYLFIHIPSSIIDLERFNTSARPLFRGTQLDSRLFL